MKTVKEFKDLGVVFVCGDVCKRDDGDPFTVNAIWVNGAVANGFRDEQKVVSFAWRPLNTLPDNPKFKYEIGGHMPQWRPLLDQSVKPDINPVFTQSMADAGELPPVGSYFTVSGLVGECLLIHCGDIIAKFDTGVMPVNQHECKPIDTRTPKQKAVDEIQDVVCSQGFLSKQDVSLGIAKALYDAGYRKC